MSNLICSTDMQVVASLLSSRGITVTPAQNAAGGAVAGQTPAKRMRNLPQQNANSPGSSPSATVPTLNLNSAISILPAGRYQFILKNNYAQLSNLLISNLNCVENRFLTKCISTFHIFE